MSTPTVTAKLPWLSKLQTDAQTSFEKQGYPTVQNEDWRFTNVEAISRTTFSPSDPSVTLNARTSLSQFSFPGLDAFQMVFVNGVYQPKLSHIPKDAQEVHVQTFSDQLKSAPQLLQTELGQMADVQHHPFVAQNTARFIDGIRILVKKNSSLTSPIHLLYISQGGEKPTESHPRVLIHLEEGSFATVIEDYVSMDETIYFTNSVTEARIEENAKLNHYKIERESTQAFHVSNLSVHQARSSTLNSNVFLLGGALVRNEVFTEFKGEGAECHLNGLYLGKGTQHMDSYTLINHGKSHGTSHELYKGVLDNKANAIFNGKVVVALDAQKTDSVQTNKNLLLSDEAHINTKPELQILANDVKCKHGATIGQIDANALFYLRSRGVPLPEARQLLIYAFVSEMIDLIEIPALKSGMTNLLFQGTR